MKFTLNWLKDHLDTNADLDEILAKLTLIGLEVEEVVNPAADLANFSIAKITSAEKHPDADKLQVCKVDTGNEELAVVCGAPNAKKGLIGVFAPVGTYVPGIDFTLTKAKIRGVESNGMMCSESELNLSDEHDGIIELPASAEKLVGTSYIDYAGLDDPVIEIAITPNRPDCLGVRGIARDLAAAGLGKLKKEDTGIDEKGDFKSPIDIELNFSKDDSDLCPAFWGRMIKGVTNKPSPAWLRQRLRAIGLRPINALVDITNYISYDRARPLHVYDADKLDGPLCARLGSKGENLLALDGKEYNDIAGTIVIADKNKVLGLAGIMGGEASGSTDETTNVIIESAYFDPIRTAKSGRRLNINSDARFRFERGIDPQSIELGVNLAAKMIMEICGGEPSQMIKAGTPPPGTKKIEFDPKTVTRLTGVKLSDKKVAETLKALGFKNSAKGKKLTVTAPSWRPDIGGSADLVEEVIRIVGLDQIEPTPLPRPYGIARPVLTATQKRVRYAKRALASRGFVETITWSFIRSDDANRFGGASKALKLDNPISADLSDMRPSLLPGLISGARRNIARGVNDPALMEVGEIYLSDDPSGQFIYASGVRCGTAKFGGSARHWQGAAGKVDVFDAKSDATALLASLGVDTFKCQITSDAPAWFHPGRSGTFRLGPKITLGVFGEIHPAIIAEMDIEAPLVGFEINVNALPEPKKKTNSKGALQATDLQPLTRDYAFIVNSDVPAGDLIKAANSADKALITGVTLFDIFEGASLGSNKKSLAIEVTLQPKTKTLTDDEIEALSEKVIAAVKKATGGEIRS